MADDLQPEQAGQEEQSVTLGGGQQVSMQLIQDIYNELTGKSENIRRIFRIHHKTTFEDLYQLDAKINQMYEQYNIISKNTSVTLYHVDEGKEEFSSFGRFKIYDKSSLSPVENIRMKYNFLIVLPKSTRPQSYVIEVNIHSRVALRQRSEAEHGPSRKFLRIFSLATGQMKIEYVDYAVARNFSNVVDQWFMSLDQSKSGMMTNIAQDYSEYIPLSLKFITSIGLLAYFYINIGLWLNIESGQIDLFRVAVLCFGSVYILSQVVNRLGRNIEHIIDMYQPLSYVKLNRGDEVAIQEMRAENRKTYISGVSNLVAAIVANVLALWVVGQF